MITFHVPGPPLPWMRAASSKDGRRYTPKKQRDYQHHVCMSFLRVAFTRSWSTAERYRVTAEVTFHDARRRDIDNACKSVLDALNGTAYDDDSQVDELHVKRMPPSKTAPGLKVTIEVINGGGEHG